MFSAVHTIDGGRRRERQISSAIRLIPHLWKEHYDVVIDLQRNFLTRSIRRLLRPKSFSEFDRFSFSSAGERVRDTIVRLGFTSIASSPVPLQIREEQRGLEKLITANFDIKNKLIVLNPAGSFVTREWPLENYIQFSLHWKKEVDANAQFIILGAPSLKEKANFIKAKLGENLIDLVGSTTVSEAFNILRHANLVVSEDSGLMHMAWVAGVPVVALFGSTRSAWSRPLGDNSLCLNSSDLECGECLQAECRFGDTHCLTRYTPNLIVEAASKLLENATT